MSGVSSRKYDGPALDGAVQHLSEALHWQGDGETDDVVLQRVEFEERDELAAEFAALRR